MFPGGSVFASSREDDCPLWYFCFCYDLKPMPEETKKNTIYKEDVSITQQESDNETVQKDPLGKCQCYFAIFLNPKAFLLLHL